ncbi:MAG TPA: S1 RNA-binding domain-containing protein [Petrotogaceae bacterium]|jgi:small subunit ribosomal protein S1|nr:S1 RNA-binding domain-containing protein [Petrotogaceae bacterium]HPA93388.1 S1 RNA-binding domain-containing protein [Petrotogaceae bacterium]HPX16135.1 S1 RNA-binding domain-containing protein [Petrotogaceae bacterium]HQC41211.1 S1 RNA-binding domain-containing protein [Petrotogaceae bacterium]HQO12581.1 S1 RNA-binding domain-containing protein [Petrotogaceae bacterium]
MEDRKNMSDFEQMLNDNEFNELKKGKVFTGKVFESDTDGIWVALEGSNGDVFVKREDLTRDISEYKSGEEVTVKIVKTNDEEGLNHASEKQGMFDKLRNEIKEGDVVKVIFKAKNLKGYDVFVNGVLKSFLPGSLSGLRQGDAMPKGLVEVKVIGIRGRSITVSRKDLIDEKLNKAYEDLRENMVVEGIVESIKEFGAFVRINDSVTALIPKSEATWDRNMPLETVLKVGSKVRGMIIKVDKENRKISLSLKQLTEDPWIKIEEKYPVDCIVRAVVTQILPFGFTVKLEPGVEGLIHESEIFWVKKGRISDVAKVGDRIEVKVLGVDTQNKKLTLSYKQAIGDPWTDIDDKYSENEIYTGYVEKLLPNGAIIKLEEGISGFAHVSELSWNFVDNPQEALKESEKVKVKVLNIDKENRKIKLSIKQAIDNPWKLVSQEVKKGDTVKGKVLRYQGSGAVVLIDKYDVEAFLSVKNASVEKVESIQTILNPGDEVEAKVLKIDFETEERKGNMNISIVDLLRDRENKETQEVLNQVNQEN